VGFFNFRHLRAEEMEGWASRGSGTIFAISSNACRARKSSDRSMAANLACRVGQGPGRLRMGSGGVADQGAVFTR
jgi:hypothetical protein